ncbi:Putative peptidoglycan binding domain-containing protein [Amycolatopsis tolypomycina]|uniref:Putative peptidoglycan binding domain-containing protein n=1 Tax=Amycolatopsis tolypomycina TaxID=208445 RepID=A0A1H4YYS8_9PSEU|nr:glycoside hydrolase domain-containing protein [Amycolatopsis tolypomycina]SED22745.1 Putative peptidoglycan binding domain-containing protein [Amycolatopsis tolypomycina]
MTSTVLFVQQWLNATYRDVAGYQPCPEDGVPGRATTFALVRALQHELGIAPLADNFGPSTLAALDLRGGVRRGEPASNLVRIVQSGLICRGYDVAALDGTFGKATDAAITAFTTDSGAAAPADGSFSPKLLKALLSLDSYRLAHDGDRQVRAVQQWLNGQYPARRDFFVGATDGRVSRDLVTAVSYAIQFELGMTDDNATGTFGPATRAGLKTHPVAEGDTGVWPRLYTASLVMNGYGSFTDVFDPGIAAATRRFQEFAALDVTGQGDFPTWALLMASNGDPDGPGAACDCATTITPARARALYDTGYRLVGRYLDQRPESKLDKKIKPGELDVIFAAGLKVFPISQYAGDSLGYFTREQGRRDAADAHRAAAGYGFPHGTVIYFAVDFDATRADVDGNVVPYFEGVAAGLAAAGHRYRHGVYGARDVCTRVSERTHACFSFVAGMSTGYAGNKGFPLPENWAFNQVQTLWVGEGDGRIQIDKNTHRPGSDPGVASVTAPGANA